MGNYPDERKVRRDIVEAGKRMYIRGYVSGNDGNLSARISENMIIATPSGVSKGFMTEDMLIRMSLDGIVLAASGPESVRGSPSDLRGDSDDLRSGPIDVCGGPDGARIIGSDSTGSGSVSSSASGSVPAAALAPSSEIKMHLAIYRQSPELRAVCHAHPPVSASFAAAGAALDVPYLQESVMLLGVIPVAKYALPGSEELANGAAAFSRDHHGALLEHHGAVTWGGDIMQALYRMESVEYTATVAMYSNMLGFTQTLSAVQVEELIAMRPKWGITIPGGNWNIIDK